ncbi:regulatory phage cox family protein [Vibrio sp. DW001]|uniref:hypothetical protein n=1 Tax=Vibrio sp. DW001 TaxID=2912315 RepID=UPI0023B13191|nr:hypothetical protein [Vibrio sp. DW001]WED28131.1 regulatory phage cox family protein [Vibrio sp. DW001]
MIDHEQTKINIEAANYAPFVTPEKFAELSGMTVNAVNSAGDEGRLPMIRRTGKRRGKRFVNMLALAQYAKEQAQENQDWKSTI